MHINKTRIGLIDALMYTTVMLLRCEFNPILIAQNNLAWCSKKVYNCAVHKEAGIYRMLFRAIGDDWVSRLGYAESKDGIHFTINSQPVFSPINIWENRGCEDPRMVKLYGKYYVTYTAFDGNTAYASLTSSYDLLNWHERIQLFPEHKHIQREDLPANWSKAAALFPQIINQKHYMFFGDNHIWPAVSDNMTNWQPIAEPVLSARDGFFDAAYVEMGPPPILTDKGWLVLYHGIDRFDSQRTYSLGAALFAHNNPLELIWRSQKPILKPIEPYEVLGMIDIVDGGFEVLKNLKLDDLVLLANTNKLPRAIFCCGAILENDELVRLYYSGGDTVICTATIDLKSIFNS